MRIIRLGVCSLQSDAYHLGMFPFYFKDNTWDR